MALTCLSLEAIHFTGLLQGGLGNRDAPIYTGKGLNVTGVGVGIVGLSSAQSLASYKPWVGVRGSKS